MRSIMDECLVFLDARSTLQVEIDARVDAATTKVSIEGTVVPVPIEQSTKLPKVGAEFGRRDCGVLPSFPRVRFSRNPRSGAQARFANRPDQVFLSRIIVQLHGWRM